MTVNCPQLGTTGRLGNQLFQLAATIGLARARARALEPCFPPWVYQPWFSFPAQWFGQCSEGVNAVELVPHIDPRASVYLQDFNLFAGIMEEVRSYLRPSVEAAEVLSTCGEFAALPRPIMAVHVRRGDNAWDPATPEKWRYHPMPPLEYYLTAISDIWRHEDEYASVAVFGDDPTWNRSNLPGDYFHVGVPRPKENEPGYGDPPLDWIDWHLLTECAGFVLSNSTFGITAALVSGGDAVVPWPIYGPALHYIDASLMLAPHWRRLPC